MQAVPHPLGDPGLFARAGLVPPDGLNGVGPKKLDEAVPADGPPPSTIAEGFSRLQQLAGPVAAALGYANGPLSDAFQAALRRSLQNSLLQDPTLHHPVPVAMAFPQPMGMQQPMPPHPLMAGMGGGLPLAAAHLMRVPPGWREALIEHAAHHPIGAPPTPAVLPGVGPPPGMLFGGPPPQLPPGPVGHQVVPPSTTTKATPPDEARLKDEEDENPEDTVYSGCSGLYMYTRSEAEVDGIPHDSPGPPDTHANENDKPEGSSTPPAELRDVDGDDGDDMGEDGGEDGPDSFRRNGSHNALSSLIQRKPSRAAAKGAKAATAAHKASGGKGPALKQEEKGRSRLTYKRWHISRETLVTLEMTYNEIAKIPSHAQRQQLAAQTGATPRQIQVWFRNRRQKERLAGLASGDSVGPGEEGGESEPGSPAMNGTRATNGPSALDLLALATDSMTDV